MAQVNIHEAKTHLSRLVERAASGEEITIARAGRPIARLVRYEPPPKQRPLGLLVGRIWLAPDFDKTDEEIVRLFEEGE